MVTLIVEDTGIGISDSFLAGNVFVPFKQEDPYTPGIGLGLSIVKQICDDMGAKLTLSSKAGRGTKVSIQVPITFLTDTEITAKQSQSILDEGVSPNDGAPALKVDHFHVYSSAAMAHMTDIDYRESPAELEIVRSVMDIAEEWLKCTAVRQVSLDEATEATSDTTIICAVTEHLLEAWKIEHPTETSLLLEKLGRRYANVLVLAESVQSMSPDPAYVNTTPWNQVFVHQPVGPAKLLRAIASDKDSTAFAQLFSLSSPTTGQRGTAASTQLRLDPPIRPRQSFPFAPETSTRSAWRPPTLERSTDQCHISQSSRSSSSSYQPQSTQDSTTPPGTTPTPSSTVPSVESRSLLQAQRLLRSVSGPQRVLLVEDNDINMKLLTALVSKLKMPYERATNGREAVHAFRASPPHTFLLVLMDINMPVMDGFEATMKIRDHEQKRNLKNPSGGAEASYIVALTGNTDHAARTKAFNCGVDKFYSKPVRMRELKTILEQLRRRDGDSADASDG